MMVEQALQQFLLQLKTTPEMVEFDQVMAIIDQHYDYTPTQFSNGSDVRGGAGGSTGDDTGNAMVVNEAGSNEGSCRIFAFARLNQLSEAETLACFGVYYREDVLGDPAGNNHGNIRNFMCDGWVGIEFDGEALSEKNTH